MTNSSENSYPSLLFDDWIKTVTDFTYSCNNDSTLFDVFTDDCKILDTDSRLKLMLAWLKLSFVTGYEMGSPSRHKQKGLKDQAMQALHCIMSGSNNTREQYLDFLLLKEALELLPSDYE